MASSSDLMVGVLFIFIIIIAVIALLKKQQDASIAATIKRIGDPRGFVTERIGEEIKEVSAETVVDPVTGVISFPEKILFPLGRSSLSVEGVAALKKITEQLERNLPCFVANTYRESECKKVNPDRHTIETIFVEGHTDSIPFAAGAGDNFRLSLERARAVDAQLVQQSSLRELRNEAGQPIFSFSAYADSRPRSGLEPRDSRNRRVDLRVVLTYRPIEEVLPALAIRE
jgi:flagellar motor protein MotB